MEKYGVDTEEEPKTGAVIDGPRTCPKCSKPLVEGLHVPKCPDCGTLPFEKDEGV